MSTTIGGAIRKMVLFVAPELTGLHLDFAPTDAVPPYAVYNDNVGTAPELKGDGVAQRWDREVQMDLYFTLAGEDPTTVRNVRNALDGFRPVLEGGESVTKVNVTEVQRIPEPIGTNLTHYALTLRLNHDREAV